MKKKMWSHYVTTHSNAMDLEAGVFTQDDPKAIARSLKRSAERSTRRKSSPKQSAMSMLNLYINRAGKNLSGHHKAVLERSKDELRALFESDAGTGRRTSGKMKKTRKKSARVVKSGRSRRGKRVRRRNLSSR